MEDTAIIELFFARDESALREADAKYGARLNRLARSITGDERDAEECVSDAYLAAWKAIPPTRPANLYAFLCRIARNLSLNCFDRSRAQKRCAEVVPLSAELEQVFAAPPGASAPTGIAEALDRFIRTLDEDTRLIFVRRYFYGDPLPVIAELTGICENNLSARLFRARKRLGKMLQKEGLYP